MRLFLILMVFSGSALAHQGKRAVNVRAAQLNFEFGSQDGGLVYKCTHQLIPSLNDFKVICIRPEAPTDKWEFTAHLRLFVHERPQAPKLAYEFLYWVTDHQLIGGKMGQFTGSTIWFNLQDKTPLMSLTAGQDIQNTYVLTARVDLI